MHEPIQQNDRRARQLCTWFAGLLLGVLGLIGLVLGALVGLAVWGALAGLVVAAVLAIVVVRSADAVVLARIGATPADAAAHARLHNLVEGLCVSTGIARPTLLTVDESDPNLAVIGRDPRNPFLVVTTGLLDRLDRVELEGVLAHELSHVENHDVVVSTLVAALTSPIGRGASGGIGVAHRIVGVVLAPFRSLLASQGRRARSEHREALADVRGVGITRYPPGLIAALEKLQDAGASHPDPDPASAHLWFVAPRSVDSATATATAPGVPGDTGPSLAERIERLREL